MFFFSISEAVFEALRLVPQFVSVPVAITLLSVGQYSDNDDCVIYISGIINVLFCVTIFGLFIYRLLNAR